MVNYCVGFITCVFVCAHSGRHAGVRMGEKDGWLWIGSVPCVCVCVFVRFHFVSSLFPLFSLLLLLHFPSSFSFLCVYGGERAHVLGYMMYFFFLYTL